MHPAERGDNTRTVSRSAAPRRCCSERSGNTFRGSVFRTFRVPWQLSLLGEGLEAAYFFTFKAP